MPKLKRKKTNPGFKHIKTVGDIGEYELLKNGLRILHMHLPGSGTITTNIVYLVGSRHEERGKTGLAHMFEHMLFKTLHDGTGKRIQASAFKALEDAGAISNATTWLDRTHYYFAIPASYATQALEFEAARMRNLVIDDAEFLPERANVISEYEMYFGRPFEALMTAVTQAAYVSHGYGHDTIGHKPDLEIMTTKSLRAFYDAYYWPNNAVLTVVGDITLADALALVLKAFGHIPRSPKPIPQTDIVEPTQEGERKVEVRRPSPINLYTESYKVPGMRHFEWAALDVIGAYLTDGPQSVLDDALIDTHKASSVDATASPTHDDGLFTISVQLTASSSHEGVARIIARVLTALAKTPINKKRLETIKTKIIADERYGRDGTLAISKELTECIAAGDWTRFYTFEGDIRRVTPRDVQEVAKTYFQKNNRVVGTFVGEKRKLGASQEVVDGFDQREKTSYNLNSACKANKKTKKAKP
jgi:zinc protease